MNILMYGENMHLITKTGPETLVWPVRPPKAQFLRQSHKHRRFDGSGSRLSFISFAFSLGHECTCLSLAGRPAQSVRRTNRTTNYSTRKPVQILAMATGCPLLYSSTQVLSLELVTRQSSQAFGKFWSPQRSTTRSDSVSESGEELDVVVAIEASVEWCTFVEEPQFMCIAWAVVLSMDVDGKAQTAPLMLPPPVAELITDDNKLRHINGKHSMDAVLTGQNSRQQSYLEHAITMALIPFINPELFVRPMIQSAGFDSFTQ